MTRAEIIEALRAELGRALTTAEIAFVDRTIQIRRGAINDADIPTMASDIRKGVATPAASGSSSSPPAGTETADPELSVALPRPGDADFDHGGSVVATGPINADIELRYRNAATAAGETPAQIEAKLLEFRALAQDPQFGAQAAVFMEAAIAELEAEAIKNRPQPIGVDLDFVAQRQTSVSTSPTTDLVNGRPVPQVSAITDVAPRYFTGDEYSPAGLSPNNVASIQTRLVAAGLLEDGEYWAGVWDSGTANAYKAVLGMANQSGRTADSMIDELVATLPDSIKEARARAEAAKVYQAPPYFKPDPNALAQQVKSWFRSQTGRDPEPGDLAEGIALLGQGYRQQYEAEVAAARSSFDAQLGLSEGDLTQTGGGTFTDVDPVARFREVFEQRHGPEISRLASQDDVRDNLNNVFDSLRTMSSLIGGQ